MYTQNNRAQLEKEAPERGFLSRWFRGSDAKRSKKQKLTYPGKRFCSRGATAVTQEQANGDVCPLPMNHKICQQEKKSNSRGSVKWIAVAMIAVLALFGVATSAQAARYDSNWQHRKKLTIDHTWVGATLDYFPVLVSLSSDADLAADAQDYGEDILFTSSDGTTKLDHEIEYFSRTTGQFVAWVKIMSIWDTDDTQIRMHCGNGSATSQQNPKAIWNFGGSTDSRSVLQ